MKRGVIMIGIALSAAPPAMARDSLGMFERWGAFRDTAGPRCYAIAQPVARGRAQAARGFASVGTWPAKRVRAQLHVRLSRMRASTAPVALTLGERRFRLAAGEVDAWAADARMDAAIVAAMRSATSMSVSSISRDGRPFADTYALRGAATAIDAAALGCVRAR
ncbi:MAG: hypothetical protein ABW164_01575 [Sphingobium sp.]